ncbi:MAG TPA: response regulator [Firmicutes bacterium]|jgi:response regulator of citrate/malate metabolism|nr:response regulator [Bacillota bacterium]HBK61256.1 response regulator [Bacillota bacterium]
MSQNDPRILAVDDDEAILFTLQAIGKAAGWTVHSAASPQYALELVSGEAYDLIIVDYHMPAMDGVALVRQIRAIDPLVPIMVLTVDDRMSLAERFREAGATDFAVKPVKAADFVSRVRLNLAGPRSHAAADQDMPKGISLHTMNRVIAALSAEAGWAGAEAIATRAGIAYQTVWRYLDLLESESQVKVRLVYGGRGRPSKEYSLR